METKKITAGCFLIGATGEGITKSGEALLGSVSDNPYDVRTFVRAVTLKGKFGHVGTELISTTEHTLEERGYFARVGETTRGVNAAGLAFTCAIVIEDENIKKPVSPTPYADITDTIMANCKSVDEAIETFSSKKIINPAYSVLLADANGDLAHIEVGNYGMALNHHYSRKKPGIVFAVNCYLSQTLVSYNAPHTLITNKENNNYTRQERGKFLAEKFKGKIDVDCLMQLLSDHANNERDPRYNPILPAWGYSICNHGTRKKETYPHENLPWGTVSAEILQPKKKCLWYTYGWPCGQAPHYGDQIMQENSWGQFYPFEVFPYDDEITPLTTPFGEIIQPKEVG